MLDCPTRRGVRDGRVSNISNRPSDRESGCLDRPEVYCESKYGVGSMQRCVSYVASVRTRKEVAYGEMEPNPVDAVFVSLPFV